MLLNQLVEVNQKGLVARAVSFSLMDVTDKNLKLCEGFVFNHDSDSNRAKNTTVGILHAIRHSFHSASKPNVHLIVQDYGKGKSHFALTVANFFKHPYSSDEVQGILAQLRSAAGENSYVYEDLLAYKKIGNHLVLCLSAEDVIDMRKHFFKVLNQELEKHGITDTISQQNCREPLNFLQKLDGGEQHKAEVYLKTNFSTTLADVERRLSENDFKAVSIVKEICIHVKGVAPDFSGEIPIKDTIAELITNHCGSGKRFNGILILFDELYEYLQKWTSDPVGAGGLFLQNITQACQDHSEKIALVSLSQKRPSGVRPPKHGEDYNRLVSRIETPSTYNPKASLELVLDGLLEQPLGSSTWQAFEKRWGDELKRKSLDVFSKYADEYYRGINWKHEDFYRHLTVGCFPLHPLTSYLLCNLSFTQGRSAIDFVQKEVEEFIRDHQVEENGRLNFIYPISLVDAFEGNFANPEANTEYTAVFSDYNYSLNKVNASSDSDPDEVAVLKSILLFYTSSGRIKKSDKDKHEEVLESLTGLSSARISAILEKLCKVREVIYHSPADNTYKFYGGGKGIDELRYRVRDEIKNKEISIDDIETHCSNNVAIYIRDTTIPQQFVDVKKLRSEDWFFKNEVYTVRRFRSLLQKKTSFKVSDQAGLVAYVIAETNEEILLLERDIKKLIEQHPYRDQIVVAIAQRPVEELGQLLLMQKTANKLSSQEFGAALTQLKEQYSKQIKNETKEVFNSFTFHCHLIDDIPTIDRTNVSIVVSEILEKSYYLIPPIEGVDKLALKSNAGSEVIGDITKRIARGEVYAKDLPTKAIFKNIIDPVFVRSWGLLRLTNQQYKITIPSEKNVKAAWEEISKMTALADNKDEQAVELTEVYKTLSSPPYGYNPYTFTMLLSGWMAYHRSEVFLKGASGIASGQQSVPIKPLKDWAETNIFNKPKDFINKWILAGGKSPLLIRRKASVEPTIPEVSDYTFAKQKIEEVSSFLSNSATPEKYQTLSEQYQSLEKACIAIEQQFEPVLRVENLIESTAISSWSDIQVFLDLSPKLQSKLEPVTEGGLTVTITAEQDRRYTQALQSAREKINEAIEIEGDRHTKLNTEEACGIHKANLTQAIYQLNQIENIPPRFLQVLEKSLSSTEKVIADIDLNKKIKDGEAKIQVIIDGLSDTANQQDYIKRREQIEFIANELPKIKQSEGYRIAIESIDEKQDSLIRQLVEWELSGNQAISKDHASNLKDKINLQRLRYTDESSQTRLKSLLEKLDDIVKGIDLPSDYKNLVAIAKAKLDDIRTTKNPIDYTNHYLRLAEIKLVDVNNTQDHQTLNKIKADGFSILEQRISQIAKVCQQPLDEQSNNSSQLRSILNKLHGLITSHDELATLKDKLNEASQSLKEQEDNLTKRINDKKIMSSIRQYSLAKANTLHLCEEAITEIEVKRLEINFPEDYAEEIDSQIQSFREKADHYIQSLESLQEELSVINEPSQLTRLRDRYNKQDYVFRNSSQFAAYQQLESHINTLDEDIKVITQIQDLASVERAYNIATCDHAITQIDHVKPTLLETERFALSIQSLKDSLIQRKQSYLSKLIEFRDGLNNAATTKEVRQVRKQLNDSSSFYQGSTEVQDYNTVTTEADLLISLLQLFESQKVETSEDCALEIAKLNQWKQDNPEITPAVRSRFETKLEELTNKQQELQASQRKSAKSWFESTQQRRTKIEQIEDQSEKILESNKLLKRIKERFQYEQLLEPEQKQFLEETTNFCNEIKNLDREEKILDLFQELPKTKRESVLKRLAELLEHSGEDS
jgi:hypothetical protein